MLLLILFTDNFYFLLQVRIPMCRAVERWSIGQLHDKEPSSSPAYYRSLEHSLVRANSLDFDALHTAAKEIQICLTSTEDRTKLGRV